ncbi:MAG: HD-GYP domain-containing protein [Oscillospiraceae bacterium]|nr:HD-GYP domain-containing protein [Oscillospiraceae bacterium]
MRKRVNTSTENQDISILALDDDPVMTLTLQSYFQSAGFQVDAENDPIAAIERVRGGQYDVLLLDFLMTPICGDQVVERIRAFNQELFIILLTGHKSMAPPIKTIRALDIQGYYEKSDRFDQLELLVESCVKSIHQMRTIRIQNEELVETNEKLRESYLEIIRVLRLTVDARDIYTRGHSDRVSYYAVRLARAMGRDDAYCERVRIAGLFHDVGKLSIPDSILLKDAPLSAEEYDEVKEHPARGFELLSSVKVFQDVANIVRSHHERVDGHGYPDGLRNHNIPEEARMIAVADSFDAMTSTRRYRARCSLDYARSELRNGAGTQFDAEMVHVFLELLKHYDNMRTDLAWTYDENKEETQQHETMEVI